MAFFKTFQNNLPTVNITSILDSVSSRVDDIANSVSDATYAVSDQLTEGVTTIVKKVQSEEEGDNAGGGGTGQEAGSSAEGKARSKSIWQITRDNDPETQANDSTENEYVPSQLEWEWRDGGWRVKRTEEELVEEEKKKKEQQEMDEKRDQKRKERQAKRMEAQKLKEEEEGTKEEDVEETESLLQEEKDEKVPETQPQSDHEVEPEEESERKSLKGDEDEAKESQEEEEEEEVAKSKKKKKKLDKKKEKEPKEEVKKEVEKSKKSKKGRKKKGKEEAVLDSEEGEEEEERCPEPMAQQRASAWSSKQEQEGYSSEASSERATIQRITKDASLNELQPPPYPEERKTSTHSHRGGRKASPAQRCPSPRGSSEASEEEEPDSESYLHKGCDEDIPSDSTAVLGQEDGSAPPLPAAYEPEPMAKYGTLDVAFEYDSGEQWLAVTVTAATDIPALKQTGNISWQVHLVLLPTKKQRAKTGVQKGPCPVFTETFKFSRVEQDAIGDYAVRFRLYSIRRMKKEKVLGEKVFYLTKLNLQGKMALPVTLEPGSEATGCGSVVSVSRSGGALSYRSTEDTSLPEILLGLIYNSTTGRLSAEVIQGSHFRSAATDKPIDGLFCCVKHCVGGQLYIMRDTYVKLVMLDSKGKEMSKCKTAVCRGHPNPTYKETFMFQVALFQLSEVSLVLSVFCRRSTMRKRERLGWVSLGMNSTSEEQLSHWSEMREAEGQQICHWHTLTDT